MANTGSGAVGFFEGFTLGAVAGVAGMFIPAKKPQLTNEASETAADPLPAELGFTDEQTRLAREHAALEWQLRNLGQLVNENVPAAQRKARFDIMRRSLESSLQNKIYELNKSLGLIPGGAVVAERKLEYIEMATPATSWWGSEGRIRIYFDPAEEGARELAYETARKAKISDGFKGLKADIAVGIGAASVAAAMLPGDEAVDFVAAAAEGDLKGMAIAGIGGIIPGANALGEVMDPARKAVGSVGDSEKALKKATDGLDSAGDTLKKAPDEAVAKLEKKVEDAVEEGAAVAPNTIPKASTINGIKAAGKFDDTVGSLAEARAAIRKAFPDAVELPPAISGQPYPSPPPGVKKWFQVHPPEPGVGNNLPHIKYADWTTGKKGTGGSWGHLFFPE